LEKRLVGKVLFGFFAMIGFIVIAVLALALGLLAYDELKRKLLGADGSGPSAPEGGTGGP
jgi:hypothetical protein